MLCGIVLHMADRYEVEDLGDRSTVWDTQTDQPVPFGTFGHDTEDSAEDYAQFLNDQETGEK